MGRYCLECGHPLELRVIDGRQLEACPRCAFVLWPDPKLATAVVVEMDGGVVLGRRAIEPGYGEWCLPGGFVDQDEHPERAGTRECLEEIGAAVELTGLLGVYHVTRGDGTGLVVLAYRGRVREGERLAPGKEMLEVSVFAPDRLPELAFASHTQVMSDWLARVGEAKT